MNTIQGISTDQAERPPLHHLLKLVLAITVLVPVWLFTVLATRAESVPPKPTAEPAKAAKQSVYTTFLPLVTITLPPVSPKKGLAWTYQYCEDVNSIRALWVYDWGMNPKICNSSLESIPMIRDADQWARSKQVGGNSQWILGFNEPDLCPDQACLTPAQAIPLWHEIEAQFPNKKLVAPVPSQVHLNWLVEFRDGYIATYGTPPRFDALAMHWYGFSHAHAKAVIDWYKARATEFGVRELWLTEFSFPIADKGTCCGYSQTDVMNDAQKLMTDLDNDPMITRYAWFAPRIDPGDPLLVLGTAQCGGPLLDFTGKTLTNWGTMYRAH